MTTVFSPFKEITPQEFKRATEVTYLGVVYGTMAALRRMLPRNQGCIVEVGSALAFRSIPLQSAYCGAKHAIRGFVNSLHSELLHDKSNVCLTMVHLPAINTPQFEWCKTRLRKFPSRSPQSFSLSWHRKQSSGPRIIIAGMFMSGDQQPKRSGQIKSLLASSTITWRTRTIQRSRPSKRLSRTGRAIFLNPFRGIRNPMDPSTPLPTEEVCNLATTHRLWVGLAGSAALSLGPWALKKNR